jgi:hypothetical protein
MRIADGQWLWIRRTAYGSQFGRVVGFNERTGRYRLAFWPEERDNEVRVSRGADEVEAAAASDYQWVRRAERNT